MLAQILTRNQDNSIVLKLIFEQAYNTLKAFESELDGGQKLISQIRLLISLFKWVIFIFFNLSNSILNFSVKFDSKSNFKKLLIVYYFLMFLGKA